MNMKRRPPPSAEDHDDGGAGGWVKAEKYGLRGPEMYRDPTCMGGGGGREREREGELLGTAPARGRERDREGCSSNGDPGRMIFGQI